MATTHERLSEYAAEIRKLETVQLEFEIRAQAEHHGLLRNQIADTNELDPLLNKLGEDLFFTVQYLTITAQELERRYIP
jgi:hypothetical protein